MGIGITYELDHGRRERNVRDGGKGAHEIFLFVFLKAEHYASLPYL